MAKQYVNNHFYLVLMQLKKKKLFKKIKLRFLFDSYKILF